MRHRVKGRQLGRTHAHKKAMLNNLVTSLLRHERVVTTLAKAKEVRGVADRCITYAKRAQDDKGIGIHNRRLAARYVNDANVLNTLFTDYAERFAQRPGGYTRIMKIGWRRGDAADMAVIELMPAGDVGTAERRRRTTARPATASTGPVTSKETFDAPKGDDQ